jgi:hypothetical protein
MPVMPMILPWSMAIRWSVSIFEPAAMNRFRLRHFELLAPVFRRCRLMSDFTD